jgi:glycosyltransferase involved in cell wall biosynthesis
VRTLRRLVAGADVVHAQDALYATSVAALTVARRRGVPSLLTQHVAFVPQGNAALDLAQRAAIATLGRAARLATRVVALNPSVAEWAQRTWRLREVQTLPVGVPPLPAGDRVAVRAELGLEEGAFVALFAGRDVPKKRLDVFLGAADPSYELVAVTDRVPTGTNGARLVPFMEPDPFRRLLAAVDAFVLPSEGEGLPLALQEAFVAGIPCVVTREPGYERYFSSDEALLVRPHAEAVRDALRRLAGDPALRVQLAERSRAVGAREFGLEPFLDAYERVYRELAA